MRVKGSAKRSFFTGRWDLTVKLTAPITTPQLSTSVADFNGDGAMDVVSTTNGATNNLRIFLGNTRRVTFAPRLNLLSAQNARAALSTIEFIQRRVSAELGNVGAQQSRLLSAARTLDSIRTESDAALGRIRDVDVAREVAKSVRLSVLRESQTALLAQANQNSSLVLGLLA